MSPPQNKFLSLIPVSHVKHAPVSAIAAEENLPATADIPVTQKTRRSSSTTSTESTSSTSVATSPVVAPEQTAHRFLRLGV